MFLLLKFEVNDDCNQAEVLLNPKGYYFQLDAHVNLIFFACLELYVTSGSFLLLKLKAEIVNSEICGSVHFYFWHCLLQL